MFLVEHGNELVVLVSYAVILCFVLAVSTEIFRRYRAQTQSIREEWASVRQMAKEKGVSPESWISFEQLLKRHAQGHPLATLTSRREFNHFVESVMSGIQERSIRQNTGVLCRELRVSMGLDYAPPGQRLESTRDLHKGSAVFMNIPGDGTRPPVSASIAKIDEDRFFVTAKSTQALPKETAGAKVEMRLWHEDDARYVVNLVIEEIVDVEDAWGFHHTSDIDRLQARTEFRVPYDMPTEVSVLPVYSARECLSIFDLVPVSSFNVRFSNLSAGGFALVALQTVPDGTLVRLNVPLEEAPLTGVHARIIRSVELANGRFLLRASFLEISDAEHELITRFVFTRQRQHRGNSAEMGLEQG